MSENQRLKPGRKPGSGTKQRLTVTVERDTLRKLRGMDGVNISGLVDRLLSEWLKGGK